MSTSSEMVPAPGYGYAPIGDQPFAEARVVEAPGFVVGYTPVKMANQVATMGVKLRSMVMGTLFSAVIWTAVWWWQRASWGSPWLLLVGYAISLAGIVWAAFQLFAARRALGRIPVGEALRLTADGMVAHTLDGQRVQLGWHEVRQVGVWGHEVGAGPRIKVLVPRTNQPRRFWQRPSSPAVAWQMPLYYLDALPGTIDGALRAFSDGRQGLDVTGLDTFW